MRTNRLGSQSGRGLAQWFDGFNTYWLMGFDNAFPARVAVNSDGLPRAAFEVGTANLSVGEFDQYGYHFGRTAYGVDASLASRIVCHGDYTYLAFRGYTSTTQCPVVKAAADMSVSAAYLFGGPDDFTVHDMAKDSSGNVYLAGSFTDSASTRATAFAVKLDSSLAITWKQAFQFWIPDPADPTSVNKNTYATGIAVDGSDVYVTGYVGVNWSTTAPTSGSVGRMYAAKLDSSGSLTWAQTYYSTTTVGAIPLESIGNRVAVDGSYVYLAGKSGLLTTPVRGHMLQVATSDGSVNWQKRASTAGDCPAVAADSSGAWLTASTGSIFKLSTTGSASWINRVSGGATIPGADIAVDGTAILVAGRYASSTNSGYNYLGRFPADGTLPGHNLDNYYVSKTYAASTDSVTTGYLDAVEDVLSLAEYPSTSGITRSSLTTTTTTPASKYDTAYF